ncbi:hypothetical protein [Desulfosporosinus sp. SB140]|uniref:hypothetical protein n=1 Tax=Desulfosporosinus paludis TaxID=3115649 RepID=UPI00388D66CA
MARAPQLSCNLTALPNQNLTTGLALVIPSPSQTYTVKSGDTLWKNRSAIRDNGFRLG